ncbi:MAG TPA: hypothetical protein VMG14_03135 [Thermoplasmata archaeon]|jgi:hypothetical protein|nr:hypothetical protein [Thermoplasmata archaeon]
MSDSGAAAKRPPITLTPGSRVRVRSAGADDTAIVSTGLFRGLVSIGGDNIMALELDGSDGDEKGRIRLVPIPALLAIDILEIARAEEEKRSEPAQSPGYFR